MNTKQYRKVGQRLKIYRHELILRLWQAAVDCRNIETGESALRHLTQTLTDAFYDFLQDCKHQTPTHLGHILTQARATPIFLTQMNKAIRSLCLTHLQAEMLIVGLEASADFFALLVQSYVQENQGLLKLESIQEYAKTDLKASLTQSEIQILAYLVTGKTNKQIAEFLGVSVRTVANYLKIIRRKLNTQSRADTIAVAMKLFEF